MYYSHSVGGMQSVHVTNTQLQQLPQHNTPCAYSLLQLAPVQLTMDDTCTSYLDGIRRLFSICVDRCTVLMHLLQHPAIQQVQQIDFSGTLASLATLAALPHLSSLQVRITTANETIERVSEVLSILLSRDKLTELSYGGGTLEVILGFAYAVRDRKHPLLRLQMSADVFSSETYEYFPRLYYDTFFSAPSIAKLQVLQLWGFYTTHGCRST
jgi:hypothetical protein